MAIDLHIAKTLLDRLTSYVQAGTRDPAFVFNGLFNDIPIDDDNTMSSDDNNTMSSIANFLYQIRFDGGHLYKFIETAAAGIDAFDSFTVKCTNMRIFLTPCVVQERILGLYSTGGEVFNIDFIKHTYDERVDKVLHDIEDPIELRMPTKTEREQIIEEAEQITKDYLSTNKLKYRFELMRLELRTSKKSVWFSRKVRLPVRIVRNMSRIRSAINIFFVNRQKMDEFVRRQSEKKVSLYQQEQRVNEQNKKRSQWKTDHHDTVITECNAVRKWLHDQGYVRAPVQYWH